MGYGIDVLSLLDVINQIILPGPHHKSESVCTFVSVTLAVVRRLLSKNKTIAPLINAHSTDKQRANNATKNRDYHFTKLNNYAFLLHKSGLSPYGPDYSNWPSDVLYNMVEVGLDITKH
eukprot:3169266-Ditylum_brightwellii.AAC.1